MSTLIHANEVVRHYSIAPAVASVNGHRSPIRPVDVGLRYTEGEITNLHRDSIEAAQEALGLARRKGMVPANVAEGDLTITCVKETLRRTRERRS